uniref:Cell morphogenesis protein N-terminal domain-containing protein n=1 Tax=Romanomermis culicivorax TaxID=13658 RepID=A0A915J2V8_ROMCU
MHVPQKTLFVMSVSPERKTINASPANSIVKGEENRDVGNFSESCGGPATTNLPWGAVKVIAPSLIDLNIRPGEYVAQTLLIEFISITEKKIQNVLQEPLEKSLSKSLQRGEDSQFDQLITALYSVSEHCLPSILKALFAWYDYQNRQLYLESHQQQQIMKASSSQTANILMSASASSSLLTKSEAIRQQNTKNDVRAERDYMLEKKGLAVDFIFCLVLIEILKQMPLHPGHEDLVNYVVQLAFKQFRYKELSILGPNAANVHCIADLFAEVIGVLAQSRFFAIRKKFTQDLNELKGKETSQDGVQNIVSLFMGMKFFRVKMVPIEEFEISMNFLYELGAYFLDAKDREIKHALAALFVEILIPVAANVKTEVNVPAVKNLVDLLYAHTLDLAAKRKHSLAFFPLLTCLLCISQKHFFLSNWHYFLTMCLSNLKNKDVKMSRVALESLYRLVYVVRIKCESNTATQSRLQSICNSLFPKGGRYVIPRETPLNLFVKILHFIAQERLDFAFKEVIFDLLCVGRPIRSIYPERMNIGLRALLVIADSLQQCDGPPPMPKTVSVLPSGNTLRVKRTYLTKPLTVDIARSIGIDSYYGPCLRSFEGMLRALDTQVGRPMMMTVVQNVGREAEDMLSGDRKPKLDLFRTCIAAMPRILPENMGRQEVVDLLLRLTIHMDEELKALACQTLQNIVVECRDWREDIIYGLLQFITKEIHDNYSVLLDSALRLLHQLLQAWKNSHQQSFYGGRKGSTACVSNIIMFPKTVVQQYDNHVRVPPVLRSEGCALVLHSVEGLALVMLCQCRPITRRLALNLMKEIRQMLPILCSNEEYERPVIDALDSAVAYVSDKYIQHVHIAEKMNWPPANQMDFSWALDRLPVLETDFSRVNSENGNEYFQWDAWASALSGFLEPQFLLTQCPTAVSYAWPAVHMRISAIFSYVDPNNPQNDTRASLLRSSKSRSTAIACSDSLSHNTYLSLWQKYLVFACGVAPPASNGSGVVFVRSVSPFPMLK